MTNKKAPRFLPFYLPLYLLLALFALYISSSSPSANAQAPTSELLRNGSLEGGGGPDGKGGGVPDWMPFGLGYDIDRQVHHAGDQSIRCDSLQPNRERGAQYRIALNQAHPVPIMVSGWSKADQVQGNTPADYSLYIDAEYMDGTPLWGTIASFRAGTHDWQRRHVIVRPAKPLRSLTLIALFRNHTGTAWFDDLSARPLDGSQTFDGQSLKVPVVPVAPGIPRHVATKDGLALDIDPKGGIANVHIGSTSVSSMCGGFLLRDVAKDGPLVPVRGYSQPSKTGGINLGANISGLKLAFNAKVIATQNGIQIDGEMTDLTKRDRAISVYLALPVDAIGWKWGDDIRHAQTIVGSNEYTHQTNINVGATGGLSLYPFACVATDRGGVGIASQMDWPSVYRIFYHGPSHQFVIAWDVALTGKTLAWPANSTRFRCNLFSVGTGPIEWSFRRAAERFYTLNSAGFKRRAKADGIWLPFTDPAKIQNIADFGFAYHEGDNSVKRDNEMGLLSFRYTEPMTYWLPMPPSMPRTYDNALALINKNAGDATPLSPSTQRPTPAEWARAVLNSGTQDPDGRYNLQFENAPWANGAVFVLNPNPELSSTPDKPTRASLAYTLASAARTYDHPDAGKGHLDGEYLDSLEGWADTLDYRPGHLASSPYPLPFDIDDHAPVLPQWYSTHAFTRFVSQDLHNRDRLLMANTVPVRFSIYAPLLDIMGIEVNWLLKDGTWQPDTDELFNFRRTMSYQKPYLLLMNTDFDRFTPEYVEKYFQRCLFYGVFPSMFSANAADNTYWDTPKWHNRDRALFRKYIPLIKELSAAGWEPVPYARCTDPSISVERFGPRHFTVHYAGKQPDTLMLSIDLKALNIVPTPARAFRATEQISGQTLSSRQEGNLLIVQVPVVQASVCLIKIDNP